MEVNVVLDNQPVRHELPESLDVVDNAIVSSTPEAEKAPSWFRQVVKKVSDAWFDPKSFEQNPTLYEKLGVKKFKHWMPSSGNLVYRLVWKKLGAPDWIQYRSESSLRNMEKFTRLYETIHVAALGYGIATLTTQLQTGQLEAAAFTAGLNTLVNVYPILVNRYNRARLYRAINKLEERDNKSTVNSSIQTEK